MGSAPNIVRSVQPSSRFTQWLGGRDYLVLVAVLLIVAGSWGFIKLLDEVREGATQKFDDRAIRFVGDHAGPQWLQETGRDITALGGFTVLILVTAAVTGFLLLKRKDRAAAFLLGATIGGIIVSGTLKHFVDRPRPELVAHRSYVYTTSFPSGHSMLSAVVYLTLGSLLARYTKNRKLRLYFLFVALTLVFLVGISRVYMAVHWPTDVLAGWTAGCVWALLCWTVARILQRRGAVETNLE
jgi:undecaprenyl-diphosphatase